MDNIKPHQWTLKEVRKASLAMGAYFFDRETMKFFGDTMQNFKVVNAYGKVYIERLKKRTLTVWEFNIETSDIRSIDGATRGTI